ncbi:MAG: EamA family transporter [Chloroflexota bacterium]|nr:EamA family transporter [Chloroflexota bacterium]
MVGLGIALALASAVFHAAWNILLKTSGDPLRVSARAATWSAVIATPFALVAWIATGRPSLPPEAYALAVVSGGVELAYFQLLSAAYRAGDVSTVYPVARGTAPVIAVLAGIGLLGQRLTTQELVGVALVIVGIWSARPPGRSRAVGLALATGVAIATYTTIDQVGVHAGPFWLYAYAVFVSIAVWLAPFRGRAAVANALPVGALTLLAYAMVLTALSLAPLAIVAPLRETGIVVVGLWGVFRLGENARATARLAAASFVLAGVALLATAA